MIDKWLSASSIAKLLGLTARAIRFRAIRELWPYRTVDGNGGPQRRFHIKDLPEDIQAAYAASLQMPLEALQNQLKPPPKAPVKVTIDGYKGRSKEDTLPKPGTHVPKPSGTSHSIDKKSLMPIAIPGFPQSNLSNCIMTT
jgi:DNA-binding transcriptional MerR regulator